MNLPALVAAGAASVLVYQHGIVGQRWFVAQLSSVQLEPTKPWGDADITRRVFAVAWHLVTAVFLASAVTLYLAAFEAVESRELLGFISIAYAGFIGVGLLYFGKRPGALARPFAAVVVSCLVGVSAFAWFA